MRKNASPPNAKERLLEAAIRIFALHGFEGASARLLVKEAGVNISAITYYFKDKEGLYVAALEHIASTARSSMSDHAHNVRDILDGKEVAEQELEDQLHAFLRAFIEFLLGGKVSSSMARIFLREQMNPTRGFKVIYESTMRPIHETLTQLVARLAHLPFPGDEATLCAHSIVGQIIVFKTHREAALRRLGWKKYGEWELEKITKTILNQTDFIIDAYRKGKAGVA